MTASGGGFVLDASVAVKLFLLEAGSSEAAGTIQTAGTLAAPAIIQIETMSAVIIRMRDRGMPAHEIKPQLDLITSLLVDSRLLMTPNEALVERAAALALATSCRLADCLYVVLAQELGWPLLTADRRQAETALSLGLAVTDPSGANLR